MSFKQRLYTGYFSNQASRTATDLSVQHRYNHKHYIKEVLPYIPESREVQILELGAGYGSLQLYLQELGYNQLKGIDISDEQVQIAHQEGAKNVVVGDVIETLKASRDLDVIIGIDLLEHFTRPEALDLLDLCVSALKPGGVVLFRCPNVDAPLGTVYAYGDLTHDLFLNKSSAEQLLRASGFTYVQVNGSFVTSPGALKGMFVGILWKMLVLRLRLWLIASGRSSKSAILTPNLILIGKK